jgi:hypothetical protein
VTSRKPDDLPDFNREFIKLLWQVSQQAENFDMDTGFDEGPISAKPLTKQPSVAPGAQI